MKKAACLAMAIGMIVLLCSCKSGIGVKQGKAEAVQLCTYVTNQKWEAAAALFHPDAKIEPAMLENYFCDLGTSFTFQDVKSFQTSFYHTDVAGALCVIVGTVEIDDQVHMAQFQIVNNDNGYGLYTVSFDTDESEESDQVLQT